MAWKQGLRVPRGRLRTLDSTLSGLQVSVTVRSGPGALHSARDTLDRVSVYLALRCLWAHRPERRPLVIFWEGVQQITRSVEAKA